MMQTKRIKCYLQRLDGVTSMKLYYGCQLGNLLEKCFIQGKDTYKDALMECKFKIKWAYFLRYRSEEKTYLLCSQLNPKQNKNWKNLAYKMRFSMDRIKCLELTENQARNRERGEKRFQFKKCAGTIN